ncbi:MAG TPA: phenylalanine--tRNA ligase subunit alpha [Gammaproteobacteria bacterium]|nr:phenylalanine--tRNA ligase subunit alpha [Gammaproteobacteria bacterium]
MGNEEIERIREAALSAVAAVGDPAALDAVRVEYLGRKGRIKTLLASIGTLPAPERAMRGEALNALKGELAAALVARKEALVATEQTRAESEAAVDVTLPGRGETPGARHPITQSLARIEQWFVAAGFEIAAGPEIEDEHYNFEVLNIPADHPARALHDTFYLADGRLLRTHTSPVQIRHLERAGSPPVWMIAPGRVYRRDSDLTHTPMFHQLEGLVIDDGIHMGHLKWLLGEFLRAFFGQELALRFRPSYFPFTEPSAELDVSCVRCGGAGCRVCGGTGWLEILGCGMVHPRVLEGAGVDPARWSGFAFGLGVERLAMLRHGIADLRQLYENDLRFLGQFA